jgi:hypothetical protein
MKKKYQGTVVVKNIDERERSHSPECTFSSKGTDALKKRKCAKDEKDRRKDRPSLASKD